MHQDLMDSPLKEHNCPNSVEIVETVLQFNASTETEPTALKAICYGTQYPKVSLQENQMPKLSSLTADRQGELHTECSCSNISQTQGSGAFFGLQQEDKVASKFLFFAFLLHLLPLSDGSSVTGVPGRLLLLKCSCWHAIWSRHRLFWRCQRDEPP